MSPTPTDGEVDAAAVAFERTFSGAVASGRTRGNHPSPSDLRTDLTAALQAAFALPEPDGTVARLTELNHRAGLDLISRADDVARLTRIKDEAIADASRMSCRIEDLMDENERLTRELDEALDRAASLEAFLAPSEKDTP